MVGAVPMYHSFAHGSKGSAILAKNGDCGTPSSTFKTQAPTSEGLIWKSTDTSNPYQNEWDSLISAIRTNTPYSEVKSGIDASVTTSMGRMAAHTGQEITWDDFMACEQVFAPGVDKLTLDSPAFLRADADGKYPVPEPGINIKTEYRI